MGVDPYRIDDADAAFIESAGQLLEDDALLDYLAGSRNLSREQRSFQTATLSSVLAGKSDARFLPGLSEVCDEVDDSYRIRMAAERPWAVGYRCAGAFRGALGLTGDDDLGGVSGLAKRLGNPGFERTPDLDGLSAAVNRSGGVYVYLRDGKYPDGPSDNFAFCRAVGDAVCFPESRVSVVNSLRVAERQAMTRAFAAEVLAPVERVLDMHESGMDSGANKRCSGGFYRTCGTPDREPTSHRGSYRRSWPVRFLPTETSREPTYRHPGRTGHPRALGIRAHRRQPHRPPRV